MSNKEIYLVREEVKEIRSTADPVFYVYLNLEMVDMPPIKEDKI